VSQLFTVVNGLSADITSSIQELVKTVKLAELTRTGIVTVLAFAVVACTATPEEKLIPPVGALNAQSKYAMLWIKPCRTEFLGRCEPDDGRTTEAKLAIHGAPERVDLKTLYEDDKALSASIARNDATDVLQEQFIREFKRGATQYPMEVKANTYDLSPLYQQLGVDYLVVMELLRFNIERHYGPTGKPAANPLAVSAVRLYLTEGTTGQLLFDDYAYKVLETDDAWDNPPHYQSLADSLSQTLNAAIDEAEANLFRR